MRAITSKTSRAFAEQHLVWLDGRLQQPGSYAFVNDRVIFTRMLRNAPAFTRLFTSENTGDSWAAFFTFNRQDALPEIDAYENQKGDDALLVFDEASGLPLATRVYMTGGTEAPKWVRAGLPRPMWRGAVPGQAGFSSTSPRVLRGIASEEV